MYITEVYSDKYCSILQGTSTKLLKCKDIECASANLNREINVKLLSNLPYYTCIDLITETGWINRNVRTLSASMLVYFNASTLSTLLDIDKHTALSTPILELYYKDQLINDMHLLQLESYAHVYNMLQVGLDVASLLQSRLANKSIALYCIGFTFALTESDRVVIQTLCLDKIRTYIDKNELGLEELNSYLR